MKRSERGAVIVGILVAAGIVLAATLAGGWLNRQEWFGAAANVVQLVSAPGLLAAIGLAGWARWHRTCRLPWCLRLGEHKVAGTTAKVCTHHHTLTHHRAVHQKHRATDGRLGWGDSHDG